MAFGAGGDGRAIGFDPHLVLVPTAVSVGTGDSPREPPRRIGSFLGRRVFPIPVAATSTKGVDTEATSGVSCPSAQSGHGHDK